MESNVPNRAVTMGELKGVQGIVVRSFFNEQTLIIWSPECSYSICFESDLVHSSGLQWFDLVPGKWLEYDTVKYNRVSTPLYKGLSNIGTRAIHFREPAVSRDPSTKFIEPYENTGEQSRHCTLVPHGNAITCKEYFRIPRAGDVHNSVMYSDGAVEGSFIKLARISAFDFDELTSHSMLGFMGVAMLDDVVDASLNRSPWKIIGYEHIGRSVSLSGLLSLNGKQRHVRGGKPVPLETVTVQPDSLRATADRIPSRFSTSTHQPTFVDDSRRDVEHSNTQVVMNLNGQSMVARRAGAVQPFHNLEKISLTALVVYADNECYCLFARKYGYIYFAREFDFELGTWISMTYKSAELPKDRFLIHDPLITDLNYGCPEPHALKTRCIRSENLPQYNGIILIAARVTVSSPPTGDSRASLTQDFLGTIYDTGGVIPDKVFTEFLHREIIVEVIPTPTGWDIKAFHGTSIGQKLGQLKESWIPYFFDTLTKEAFESFNSSRQRNALKGPDPQQLTQNERLEMEEAELMKRAEEHSLQTHREELMRQEEAKNARAEAQRQENLRIAAEEAKLEAEKERAKKCEAALEKLREKDKKLKNMRHRKRREDEEAAKRQADLERAKRSEEMRRKQAEEQRKAVLEEKKKALLQRAQADVIRKTEAALQKLRAKSDEYAASREHQKKLSVLENDEYLCRLRAEEEERRSKSRKTLRNGPSPGEDFPYKNRRRTPSTDSDAHWETLSSVKKTGRNREIVAGVIVKVCASCVVLFVPHEHCYKVVVPMVDIINSQFGAECPIDTGEWMRLTVEPVECDFDSEDMPLMTHIGVSPPEPVIIHECISDWSQRFHNGVLEVFLTCDLSRQGNVKRYECLDADYFVLQTMFNCPVLVPAVRIQGLFIDESFTAPYSIRFWATRLSAEHMCIPLHLIDFNRIEKVINSDECVILKYDNTEDSDTEGDVTNENVNNDQFIPDDTSANVLLDVVAEQAFIREEHCVLPISHANDFCANAEESISSPLASAQIGITVNTNVSNGDIFESDEFQSPHDYDTEFSEDNNGYCSTCSAVEYIEPEDNSREQSERETDIPIPLSDRQRGSRNVTIIASPADISSTSAHIEEPGTGRCTVPPIPLSETQDGSRDVTIISSPHDIIATSTHSEEPGSGRGNVPRTPLTESQDGSRAVEIESSPAACTRRHPVRDARPRALPAFMRRPVDVAPESNPPRSLQNSMTADEYDDFLQFALFDAPALQDIIDKAGLRQQADLLCRWVKQEELRLIRGEDPQ